MKTSQFVCLLLVCLASTTMSYSQIKVDENNSVGIAEEAPISPLSVNDPGNSYATAYINSHITSNSSRALQTKNASSSGTYGFSIYASSTLSSSSANYLFGIKSTSYSSSYVGSKRTYGILSIAGNGLSGYNYGVYGQILGTTNGAAIFASTPNRYDVNVSGIWAGYFRGDVFIEDDLTVDAVHTSSDINLKKDVRFLSDEVTTQIDKIKALNSIKYKLKTPAELLLYNPIANDTLSASIASASYDYDKYTKDKIGLSAQEVQQVLPELVKEDGKGYLSVNYTGLIPVLIEAMKEQQAIIEELQTEVDKLKTAPIK